MTLKLATLALVFASACAAQDADFDPAAMNERFATVLQPALEKVLGATFEAPVEFTAVSKDHMCELLTKENLRLLGSLDGGLRGEDLAAECRKGAELTSASVLAKLDMESGGLKVVPEAFRTMSGVHKPWAAVKSQRFLDTLLIHEAVHVYQHRTFDLSAFIAGMTSLSELRARMSVIEGHSQFVTRKVCDALELEDMFKLFVTLNTQLPPGITDPAIRIQLEALMANMAFPYLSGEVFFHEVSGKLGYAVAVERVFSEPPTSMRQISHHAEYLDPPTGGVDLEALAVDVSKLLSEDHAVQIVPVPESAIRGAIRSSGAEATQKAMASYVRAQTIVAASKTQPGAQSLLALIQIKSPEDGAHWIAVEKAVAEAKDETFRAGGSSVELLKATYVDNPVEGCAGFYAAKELKIQGQQVEVESVVLAVDSVIIELNLIIEVRGKEALVKLAEQVIERIRGGVAAETPR